MASLTACSSKAIKENPPTPAPVSESSSVSPQENVVTTDSTKSSEVVYNPLKDPNNILSKRTVYFDLDKSDIKQEYRAVVEAHGKYLSGNTDAKVTLHGNTDNRGSREYNLSLGQRRAVSVKNALNILGVPDLRIETVSHGEEKANDCHDEACFQEDRRVDIVYDTD